jgi:hypothetical protein
MFECNYYHPQDRYSNERYNNDYDYCTRFVLSHGYQNNNNNRYHMKYRSTLTLLYYLLDMTIKFNDCEECKLNKFQTINQIRERQQYEYEHYRNRNLRSRNHDDNKAFNPDINLGLPS